MSRFAELDASAHGVDVVHILVAYHQQLAALFDDGTYADIHKAVPTGDTHIRLHRDTSLFFGSGQGGAELLGGYAGVAFEELGEIVHVGDAAILCHRLHLQRAAAQHGSRPLHPAGVDIIRQRLTHLFFEQGGPSETV